MSKVAIFGAGAVGSVLAAQLLHAGHHITVIARGAHLQAMQQQGLRYQSTVEHFTVHPRAYATAAEAGVQDVVFITVKAHMLAEVVPQIGPLLGPNTVAIFVLNGIPWWYFTRAAADSALAQQIGWQRTIGCVIQCPSRLRAAGDVVLEAPQAQLILGEPNNQISPRLLDLQQQFSPPLAIQLSSDLRQSIWQKLCINLPGSLLTTLTQSLTADVLASPALRHTFLALFNETRAVALAYGYALEDNSASLLARLGQSRHPPSMLQDLLAGRTLESDAQLLAVQQLAQQAQVATPTIDVLLPLLIQRMAATARTSD